MDPQTLGNNSAYGHPPPSNNISLPTLPRELQSQILDYANNGSSVRPRPQQSVPPRGPRHPAAAPPRNGASPFMSLSTELRRNIFAESLPGRADIFEPRCDDDATSPKDANKDAGRARRNVVSDLMTINHKICGEITEMLYEERTFVIHVHEGLSKGGIEFLHAGLQPLQYQDCIDDTRFAKFGKADMFGFNRLKKIVIQIHPADEDNCRHTAINTYFIHLALCRLLQRGGESNRITKLTVEFAKSKSTTSTSQTGRAAIQRTEHYWWDPEKQQPRETSIHGLSNVELVLRPFANLSKCHSVSIILPSSVRNHGRTVAFVSELSHAMKSDDGARFSDDYLEMKIEAARDAMEEYVNFTLHGKGHHHEIAKLTAEEMQEDVPDEEMSAHKHELSPHSKNRTGQDAKRRMPQHERCDSARPDEQRIGDWYHLASEVEGEHTEEDFEIAMAMAESLRDAEEAEEWQVGMALDASTGMHPSSSRPRGSFSSLRPEAPSFSPGLGHDLRQTTDEFNNRSSFQGQGRTLGRAEMVGGRRRIARRPRRLLPASAAEDEDDAI